MRAWIFSLCLLLSAVAFGDWKVESADGIPADVRVWRPDLFTVATGSGLYIFTGGNRASSLGGAMVGSRVDSAGCISGIQEAGGRVVSEGGCSVEEGKTLFPSDLNYNVLAVMFTTDGATGYAVGRSGPLDSDFRSSLMPAEPLALWGSLSTLPVTALTPMSVLAHGNTTHALFSALPNASFYWSRGTMLTRLPASGAPAPTPARSVVLFAGEDANNPSVLFGNDTGLFRGTLDGGSYPFAPVELPVSMSVTGVDVNTDAGTPEGFGFGLAVGQKDGGGYAMLSAVPATTPSEVGAKWRVNPKLHEKVSSPVLQVACAGAETCVLLLDKAETDNVLIYTNAHAPSFSPALPGRVMVSEGESLDVPLTVQDEDGDAVRVLVTPNNLPSQLTYEQRTPSGGEDGVLLHLTADAGVCSTVSGSFTVTATDGRASHLKSETLIVDVTHTVPPGAPGVSIPDGGVYLSGEGPVSFVPTPGAGCVPSDYEWTTPAGAPPLSVGGGVATFTPDSPLCQPTSAVHTYEVRARDSAGLSPPTPVTVTVRPWGRPTAPFARNAVVEVVSGDSIKAESLHACPASSGRPEVQTGWALVGVTKPPPGITLATVENVPVEGTPVFSAAIVPQSLACEPVTLSLTARNRINLDGAPVDGASSDFQLRVLPKLTPVSEGLPVLEDIVVGEQAVRGHVDTDLNCSDSRPLQVVVTLESEDGAVLESLPVKPGPDATWELPLPSQCSAARYVLRASLSDTATQEKGGSVERFVDVEARATELGPLEGTLIATCGQGATGVLTQSIPTGACTTVDLAWTYVDGPALTHPLGTGTQVSVETQDTTLDALIGETVTVSVTAAANGAPPVTAEHTVSIGARPFVVLRRQTETPTGAESGQVGVTVELRNPTECGVTSVRYEERLDGAELVEGSVKVDGVPMEAQVMEGGFAVEGLALPAGGGGTLTYVARPRLLTSPRFDGVALKRGVPVSTGSVPSPSTSGCGCSEGGSGAAAFGLAALVRLLRRRRGRAA